MKIQKSTIYFVVLVLIIIVVALYLTYNKQKILLQLSNSLILFQDKRRTFDYKDYKELVTLQKNASTIKNEFLNNYPNLELTNPGICDKKFKSHSNYGYYFLKFYGLIDKNEKHFPKTFNLVKSMPNIHTAFISVIKTSKKIPYHVGPYKGLLRFHLPLINDYPDQSYLQVENKKLYWNPHNPFLFDDTFKHKVDKFDKGLRVVLICDVERNLPQPLCWLNKKVLYLMEHSEYVNSCRAKKNKKN
jgi:aspartyl/asparaginyl beta-hydroxylase (cupin superfamily)